MAKVTQAKKTTTRATAAKPDPPIGDLDHAKSCPGAREEAYRELTPDGQKVIVSRCLDCPAHSVEPEV